MMTRETEANVRKASARAPIPVTLIMLINYVFG